MLKTAAPEKEDNPHWGHLSLKSEHPLSYSLMFKGWLSHLSLSGVDVKISTLGVYKKDWACSAIVERTRGPGNYRSILYELLTPVQLLPLPTSGARGGSTVSASGAWATGSLGPGGSRLSKPHEAGRCASIPQENHGPRGDAGVRESRGSLRTRAKRLQQQIFLKNGVGSSSDNWQKFLQLWNLKQVRPPA